MSSRTNYVETPMGRASWVGKLQPDTPITLPSGNSITLKEWVTLTNGGCFEWLTDIKTV